MSEPERNQPAKRERPLILIVDDMPLNIQLVGNILKGKIDCDFAIANNGLKAVEMARESLPDLILLDVMMPDMDGFEACRTLKADDKTREIPILFLTAKSTEGDVEQGFELGAVDYVTKPFRPRELLSRVKTRLLLKRQVERIARSNEEQKELLHVLCHDLANPMASVLSVMEMAERDPQLLLSIRNDIVATLRNGLNMIELARKTRAFNEGRMTWALCSVNVKTAVEKTAARLRKEFQDKNIGFRVDIDPALWVMVEETTFTGSVLNNLLSNAVKFSSRGSEVRVAGEAIAGGRVAVAVVDRGIGMPESLLNALFDVRKTTRRPGTDGETGTGFGMPLLKKFVDAYGGTIAVSSRDIHERPEDHGTEVRLELKAAAATGANA